MTAVKPYAAREMEWLTGGVSLSAVRGRERARVSAAGGWGRAAVRERESSRGGLARAREQAEGGPRGEGERARGEREAVVMGRESAHPGGEGFLFFFSFSIFFSLKQVNTHKKRFSRSITKC